MVIMRTRLFNIEGIEELKKYNDKGCRERSPPYTLGRNWVNTYDIRNIQLIAGIENSHHGPSDAQPSQATQASLKRSLFHFSQRLNTFLLTFSL
ncbi:hypothetical protein Tco_1145142 [Tanacetum coccineum]